MRRNRRDPHRDRQWMHFPGCWQLFGTDDGPSVGSRRKGGWSEGRRRGPPVAEHRLDGSDLQSAGVDARDRQPTPLLSACNGLVTNTKGTESHAQIGQPDGTHTGLARWRHERYGCGVASEWWVRRLRLLGWHLRHRR